ncbi:MAG: AI-2E family transporter [Gudongella sp.]|nr:AI-2E family transporter [Gudongella sp.]
MKVDWNVKYLTVAAYSFIVIALSIVFYLITSQLTMFTAQIHIFYQTMLPIIIGASMAYLFNFILEKVEGKIITPATKGKIKLKKKRAISMLITYAIVFTLLYIFTLVLFPQLVTSVVKFVNEVTDNFDEISLMVTNFIARINLRPDYMEYVTEWWQGILEQAFEFLKGLVPIIGNIVRILFSSIWNIVLGIVVSVYLLFEKEKFKAQIKKITYAVFSKKRADRTVELTKRADTIFGRFLSGKILDSLIIGILTYIVLITFGIPFPILVSFIIGITNIIPFFGPFIGGVPSFFIILIISPIKALWFILIIVVIQQIDGNIIGPKILGDSLGVSAFWILFSLLIAGKFLGLIGLIIGVPLFVFIYSIIKDNVETKLAKRGLPIETKHYI